MRDNIVAWKGVTPTNRYIGPEEIGRRLRELRGIRVRTGAAREMGISYSALSKYETGTKTPNDETKVKIANYYQKTVQEIFFS